MTSTREAKDDDNRGCDAPMMAEDGHGHGFIVVGVEATIKVVIVWLQMSKLLSWMKGKRNC